MFKVKEGHEHVEKQPKNWIYGRQRLSGSTYNRLNEHEHRLKLMYRL